MITVEQAFAAWQKLKSLRRHPDIAFKIRARTFLRNLMRLRKTPADVPLQKQMLRNLDDLSETIAKVAH